VMLVVASSCFSSFSRVNVCSDGTTTATVGSIFQIGLDVCEEAVRTGRGRVEVKVIFLRSLLSVTAVVSGYRKWTVADFVPLWVEGGEEARGEGLDRVAEVSGF
jgi:hypothetical protein